MTDKDFDANKCPTKEDGELDCVACWMNFLSEEALSEEAE